MTTQTISIDQALDICHKRINALQQRVGLVEKMWYEAGYTATRLRKRLCSLEATDAVRRQGRTLDKPIEFASQYGEDTVVWGLLGCPLRGYFVEVGAYDGRAYSASLALEQMGWTGLLVEPIPERAAQCKVNRPGSKVVHAALGAQGAKGQTTFTITESISGGMLSFRGEATELQRKKLEAEKATQRSITVPLDNLANLLEGCTDRVDAAIIDVEGGEVEVLKGLNLSKYRPRVMVIEDDLSNDHTDLMKFMQGFPEYVQVMTVVGNRVFVHRDEREIFDRVSELL